MQVRLYESVLQRDVAFRTALVAFGANIPRPGLDLPASILAARDELVRRGLTCTGFSRLYRTPAFPPGSGPDYINAAGAFSVAAGRSAAEVLDDLHAVEAEAGRQRDLRWGARVMDLDLLALGDLVLPDAETQDRWRALPPDRQRREAPGELILPHPRLQDRGFVLAPLADVAPDWVHPRLGLSVREMLAALPPSDLAGITPL